MHILFYLTRYPGVGGIENVTNIIASRLLEDNKVSILSHCHQEGVKFVNGVTTYYMPDSSTWVTKDNIKYVRDLFQSEKFDVIIYQDSYAPTEQIVCELATSYKIPLYVFEHNSPLFVYNKRNLDSIFSWKGFLRRLLHPYLLHKEVQRKRYLLEHATKYILLSKKFIPEFCNLIGVEESDRRISYINNPIVPINHSEIIKKENIILCVSRLAKEKCVDKMLVMWKDLSMYLPDWRFIIVGDGPERQRLEQYTIAHCMDRVEFIGFANPTEYYEKAKIFWMTSKFEGWGMTLIESMQHGCVPIAFNTFSSITDIIDKSNGFLVKPNDNQTFINRTLKLATNEDIYVEFSMCAKKKVEQFNIDLIIDKWNKLLRNECLD